VEINGVKVVTARFDQFDMEALRNTGDTIRNKLGSGVVVLGTGFGGKVSLVVMATKDVVAKGGGGRPDMAQAGGKDVSKIDEALKQAVKVIESQLAG